MAIRLDQTRQTIFLSPIHNRILLFFFFENSRGKNYGVKASTKPAQEQASVEL